MQPTKILSILIGLSVLLIILGFIIENDYLLGFGISFFIIFNALFFYFENKKKNKYIAVNNEQMDESVHAANEFIGGSCMAINQYNRDNYLDENWCNFEKRETDKTYLTKNAQRDFHPNTNIICQNDANSAFKDVNKRCGIVVEKKQKYEKEKKLREEENNNWSFSDWIGDLFSFSDNTNTNTNSTASSSTSYTDYKNEQTKKHKNMSDYDLRQSANVGNQSAYKEMADRNFARNNYNVKTNPDERTDTDFCSIM